MGRGQAEGAGGELEHFEGRGTWEGFGEAFCRAIFGTGDAALAIKGEGEGEGEAEEGAAGGFNGETLVFVAYFGRDETQPKECHDDDCLYLYCRHLYWCTSENFSGSFGFDYARIELVQPGEDGVGRF